MMGRASMKMVTVAFPDGGVANKWFKFLSFGLYFPNVSNGHVALVDSGDVIYRYQVLIG